MGLRESNPYNCGKIKRGLLVQMELTKKTMEARSQNVSDERSEMPGRKPYVKPAFQLEKVFETMALACGKVGTIGQCAGNKKAS